LPRLIARRWLADPNSSTRATVAGSTELQKKVGGLEAADLPWKECH
jgi:hypothetical protein